MKRISLALVALLALVSIASAWTLGVQTSTLANAPGYVTWSWTAGNVTAIGLSAGASYEDINGAKTKTGVAELGWRQYKPGAFLYPFYGAAVAVEVGSGLYPKWTPSIIFGMAHDLRKDLVLEFECRPVSATKQDETITANFSNMPPVYLGLTYVF